MPAVSHHSVYGVGTMWKIRAIKSLICLLSHLISSTLPHTTDLHPSRTDPAYPCLFRMLSIVILQKPTSESEISSILGYSLNTFLLLLVGRKCSLLAKSEYLDSKAPISSTSWVISKSHLCPRLVVFKMG